MGLEPISKENVMSHKFNEIKSPAYTIDRSHAGFDQVPTNTFHRRGLSLGANIEDVHGGKSELHHIDEDLENLISRDKEK